MGGRLRRPVSANRTLCAWPPSHSSCLCVAPCRARATQASPRLVHTTPAPTRLPCAHRPPKRPHHLPTPEGGRLRRPKGGGKPQYISKKRPSRFVILSAAKDLCVPRARPFAALRVTGILSKCPFICGRASQTPLCLAASPLPQMNKERVAALAR